jgi:hypothetical protein
LKVRVESTTPLAVPAVAQADTRQHTEKRGRRVEKAEVVEAKPAKPAKAEKPAKKTKAE